MKFINVIKKLKSFFSLKNNELDVGDWRLQGQEKYLMNVNLIQKKYKKYTETWDHDHCAFCSDKFFEAPEYLHVGYATEDENYWICESCFHDFQERFEWVVVVENDE